MLGLWHVYEYIIVICFPVFLRQTATQHWPLCQVQQSVIQLFSIISSIYSSFLSFLPSFPCTYQHVSIDLTLRGSLSLLTISGVFLN